MPGTATGRMLSKGCQLLAADRELAALLDAELYAQSDVLAAVAHASLAHPSVLAAAGSVLSNVTAEGYPGARYHAGAEQFDAVERLAVDRACTAFGARYANVQPHSCSSANQAVMLGLLEPGDTVLGMDLDAGGHLTHGAAASFSGRYFNAVPYGVDEAGRIDYDQVADLARRSRPRLIVGGASAYPRLVDFPRLRAIADEVGAYLFADISHTAGLVAAEQHPSPVDVAHVTTASTYKQLAGPRGGLILVGRDHDSPGPGGRRTIAEAIDRGVFPRVQGTPNAAAIAAKARAFHLVDTPAFRSWGSLIRRNASALGRSLSELGYQILTGGTDNHMVVVDLRAHGLSGLVAENALRDCGILANRNRIPGDRRPATIGSGLRLGTNILAQRGMCPPDMVTLAGLIHQVLSGLAPYGDRHYDLEPIIRVQVREAVTDLCDRNRVPDYPAGNDRVARKEPA
jgi:glycine hydroxymethyltransferase